MTTKLTRASVACDNCRGSKLKCLNETSKCQRCTQLDLECTYTLKQSQLKRRNISRKYSSSKVQKPSLNGHKGSPDLLKAESIAKAIPTPKLSHLSPSLEGTNTSHTTSISENARLKTSSSENKSVKVILPPKSIIIEVVEIYFENQYKSIFPFLHKPSFLSFIRSPEFDPDTYMDLYDKRFFRANYCQSLKYPDPVVLLAVLALTSRLHPIMPKIYGSFSEVDHPHTFAPNTSGFDLGFEEYGAESEEDSTRASQASNYFGWHARNHLKNVFDSPTIQRVQALVMLSSHEWGEGNNSRSYLYVGIAARMALVLGLGNEKNLYNKEEISEHENTDNAKVDEFTTFIAVESKRRTIWSVYMMDRCNSSGRNRSSCINLKDIQVKLPCQEKDFIFGNYHGTSFTFEEAYDYMHDPTKKDQLKTLSCFGFQIVLFELWAPIARWVGETGGKSEKLPPYDPNSPFFILSRELDIFEDSLPIHLVYNKFNLDAHIADGSAADFGYFHCLLSLCRIFLNREYFFCSPESLPTGWWKSSTALLLKTLDDIFEITSTLRSINQMVLAPFTGFEVFTMAATCYYLGTFPSHIMAKFFPLGDTSSGSGHSSSSSHNLNEVAKLRAKYNKVGNETMKLLSTWKKVWGLGRGWYYTAIKLQALFNPIITKEATSLQDDDLRHTLHDYGNGKVNEVYKPEYVRKKEMNISRLLIDENDQENHDKVSNSESVYTSTVDLTHQHEPSNENSGMSSTLNDRNEYLHVQSPYGMKEGKATASNFMNSPGLDFMNNFDLSSMFPGWSDAMKI